MSDTTTWEEAQRKAALDKLIKEANRERTASAAMLVMGVIYSIGFVMGGLVCGLIGFLVGWMIWR